MQSYGLYGKTTQHLCHILYSFVSTARKMQHLKYPNGKAERWSYRWWWTKTLWILLYWPRVSLRQIVRVCIDHVDGEKARSLGTCWPYTCKYVKLTMRTRNTRL